MALLTGQPSPVWRRSPLAEGRDKPQLGRYFGSGLILFTPGVIIKITVALILARTFLPRFRERLVSSKQANRVRKWLFWKQKI